MYVDNPDVMQRMKYLVDEESKVALMTASKKSSPYHYSVRKSVKKTLKGVDSEEFDENEFFDAVDEL